MSSQTYYDGKNEEEEAPLGLMNSLSDECTPSKHNYDRCFNTWFKDYLEVASSGNVNQSEQSSGSWTNGFSRLSSGHNRMEQRLSLLREQYEHDCGQLFSDYQACVRVCILIK